MIMRLLFNCGGHTFGKTHGAADADQYVGVEPAGASIQGEDRVEK